MIYPKSERTINEIRGKLKATNSASAQDIKDFLVYVDALESLVKDASDEDYYGTEGYKRVLGWEV